MTTTTRTVVQTIIDLRKPALTIETVVPDSIFCENTGRCAVPDVVKGGKILWALIDGQRRKGRPLGDGRVALT
jgi:hypothetical protein